MENFNYSFQTGGVVRPPLFVDRDDEIKQIMRCILKGGSVMVTGLPQSGKSSLLENLIDSWKNNPPVTSPPFRNSRYVVSRMSGLMLLDANEKSFWNQALQPIKHLEAFTNIEPSWHVCFEREFGMWTLEQVFKQISGNQLSVLLAIDEFDALLFSRKLAKASFLGSLRELASQHSCLALITFSQTSRTGLEQIAKRFKPAGSPFLNFVQEEVVLGSLDEADARRLLIDNGGEFISEEDIRRLLIMSGRQPFLLQLAADYILSVNRYDIIDTPSNYQERVVIPAINFFSQAFECIQKENAISKIEQLLWVLGLTATNGYLGNHQYYLGEMLNLDHFQDELGWLRRHGLLHKFNEDDYRPSSTLMITWIIREIQKAQRQEAELADWLNRYESRVGGLVTQAQMDRFKALAQSMWGKLKQLTADAIRAFAEGLGQGAGRSY